jgi:hypothetical protein
MCQEQAQSAMLRLFCSDNAFTSEHRSNNSASDIERSGWLFWVDNLTASESRERLCMVNWKEYSGEQFCLF